MCLFLLEGVEMDSGSSEHRVNKLGSGGSMRTSLLGPFVLFQHASCLGSTLFPLHVSLHICVAAYITFKYL